jgi:drug/metabolite transporter (DMT)-like permease
MSSAADHLAHRKSVIASVLLICAGYACYNLGDTATKMMAGKFHFSEFFFINSMSIFSFMAVYGWVTERKKAFRTKKPWPMFFRAAVAQVISICNIYSLPHLHLTTFYTVIFTSPFWVALLSAYFLKDKLNRRRMMIILFGFAVILFMFRPGGGLFNGWAVLMLLSAFLYSCQMVLVRHIGASESRPFMIMCGSAMSFFISLPFLPHYFIMPEPFEWGLFLMMGLTGSIGLLCVSYAFQMAPSASIVAPYHYTQIIWGAILGYLCFSEVPKSEVMIGAVLIIMSGIYLIHSETRRYAGTLKPLK